MIDNQIGVDISSRYEVCGEIGRGAYGVVRWAHSKQQRDALVAVKVVPNEVENEDVSALSNEIGLLGKLLHPNILRTYEVFHTREQLMLVMEFCDGGEFFSKAGAPPLDEGKTAKMALSVLQALSYMHRQGITHRDLKPPNLLRDAFGELKVADFGLSRIFKSGTRNSGNKAFLKRQLKSMVGTPGYWAPEVVYGNHYDERCDVWSLGCIVFFALSGSLPFPVNEGHENGVPERPSRLPDVVISSEANKLTQALLTFNYQDRPSASEAMELPLIKKLRQELRSSPRDRILSRKTVADFCAYGAAAPLQRAVAALGARHANLHQILHIKTLAQEFHSLDFDGKGRISTQALAEELLRCKVSEKDTRNIVKLLAAVGPGDDDAVEYAAFLATTALGTQSCLTAAFRVLDTDSDGRVLVQHLRDETHLNTYGSLQSKIQLPKDDVSLTLQEFLQLLNVPQYYQKDRCPNFLAHMKRVVTCCG
eukprot:TRINITY_DN41318_c0_g1_i1.p1 TRINITY_DN41318_c0_g1~~TRINITY_DN41318_c0_g1_i1.p1  ORF type:complete len:491 (-),score=50.14 TRINITY_DN41318_c0_g1_i1:137-1573(-)